MLYITRKENLVQAIVAEFNEQVITAEEVLKAAVLILRGKLSLAIALGSETCTECGYEGSFTWWYASETISILGCNIGCLLHEIKKAK